MKVLIAESDLVAKTAIVHQLKEHIQDVEIVDVFAAPSTPIKNYRVPEFTSMPIMSGKESRRERRKKPKRGVTPS